MKGTLGLASVVALLCGGGAVAARGGAVEMLQIPAGTFVIGSDDGDADERPRVRMWLAAYAIDRHEVTQEEYQRCVDAGVCWPARSYPGRRGDRLPQVGVRWRDAQLYCVWRGSRLPSEAEWERAARGAEPRRYPWGDALDCKRGNWGSFDGDGPCAAENPGRIVEVGSYPSGRSPDGLDDMAGNAWEWVADRYRPYGVGPGASAGPIAAKGASGEVERVLRGGSCCSYFTPPRLSNRHRLAESYAGDDVGFRCARSLDAAQQKEVNR